MGQEETHTVSTEEGVKLAKKIHALGYWETSAKTGEGVKEAFAAATKALLTPPLHTPEVTPTFLIVVNDLEDTFGDLRCALQVSEALDA